jgi:endonuclease/exonuclease/phosphatase family metal-dependent hydrolase
MRLISYNIHKGIGGRDRQYRLDRIIGVLREEEPDVVCLQEVDRNVRRSRFDHQPRLLSEGLGLEAMLDQLVFPRGEGGYGNLILSRWPFARTEQLSIRKGRRKPRGGQIAVVETGAGPLVLGHWHLGLNEKERHWQAARFLSHPIFSSGLPSLVAGDSNDWRDTLERGPFARHWFRQVTWPPARFRSFPAYLPMASLDKVFTRGAIRVVEARLVKTKLARRASDHLPLVVDFELGLP